MSERSGVREQGTERVSGASELAKGRASGPVLQSGFLVILDHSATKMMTSQLYTRLKSKRNFLTLND